MLGANLVAHLESGRSRHLERGVWPVVPALNPTINVALATTGHTANVPDHMIERQAQEQLAREVDRQQDVLIRRFTHASRKPTLYAQGSDTYNPIVRFEAVPRDVRANIVRGTRMRPLLLDDTHTRYRGPGQAPLLHPLGLPGARHQFRIQRDRAHPTAMGNGRFS